MFRKTARLLAITVTALGSALPAYAGNEHFSVFSPSKQDLATIGAGFTTAPSSHSVSNVYGISETVERDTMVWVCGDVQLSGLFRKAHFHGILVKTADGRSAFGPIAISGQNGVTREEVEAICKREMQRAN